MFEVGKQYIGEYTGRIAEVVFVGHRLTVLKQIGVGQTQNFPIGHEFTVDNSDCDKWKPYTPPKAHTEECFIKWNEHSGFHISDNASCYQETPGTVTCGKIRLTHTEGGKLAVEVLE
ncbi:hypothetical protein EVC29_062 [Rhizobium phage RHph_Y52]|nr:hypothetical protein EVB53_060 [Rhizobium phage RHph_Y60]QIG75291.1 hypothetical protein EVC16_062 [Rhizobium phage RHph_Y21]QIG76763.1 hypothetical protein EVC29_062 [Rhizobium phage RHph_Y52]